MVLASCVVFAAGCASVPQRTPLPEVLVSKVTIPGGDRARQWGDIEPEYADEWFSLPDDEIRKRYPGIVGREHTYLAISGGGPQGAYGAGLLCGWTEAGDRPEFTVVTGISTGALIAPFAFLGPDYDDVLERFYTTTTTEDVISKRSKLKTITGDAAAGTEPLQALIAEVFTQEVMDAVAAEERKGRHLVVATTNLDANRPVHWNIGAIAASGDPRALELIRQILLASASIPIAFPPVLIEVEVDGAVYDELHVDGGAAAQVFTYPAGLDMEKVLEKLDVPGMPDLYIIRNSILDPKYEEVMNKIVPIAGRTVTSMIRTQGVGNLFEIYLMARRDGLDFHLAYIPDDFDE
jgi:hypothetical protein